MTIAILAHDSRKELALQFCTAYSGILSRNTVIATGTTGRMLAQATGLPVHCYLSGKLGGIQQISARVACDEVDLVLSSSATRSRPRTAAASRTCCGCAICTACRSLPTSPPPKCCCAASTRATLTTVRASIPTSWSRCPSIGPCAEPVFKTFPPFVVLCIEGFRQRKTPQKLSHFCGVFLSYALRYH